MNHPIDNPKFNKLDYIRNGIFASTKMQFILLLEEGCSLQQLSGLVSQLQAAIARAYQQAAQDAANETIGPVPAPPLWNDFPDTPSDTPPDAPPTQPGGPNPFEDS
jgi:hypothetical protein